MVQIDVVLLDVGKLVGIKEELGRVDVFASCLRVGRVGIRLKPAFDVSQRALHTVDFAVTVVEGTFDNGRAELALVQLLHGALVVAVDT